MSWVLGLVRRIDLCIVNMERVHLFYYLNRTRKCFEHTSSITASMVSIVERRIFMSSQFQNKKPRQIGRFTSRHTYLFCIFS